MNECKRACSRCKEFKSPREFYRQGDRYESLCKTCKRESRKRNIHAQSRNPATPEQPARKMRSVVGVDLSEKEVMPVFDESIFDPEAEVRKLGFSTDDIAEIVAYFQWHWEQEKKQRGAK